MTHSHTPTQPSPAGAQIQTYLMIAGIILLVIFFASKLFGGVHISLGSTKMTLERAQELAFAQLPLIENFRDQTQLPKKKIVSQPVNDRMMYLGFAELGMNDDVTISLTCVKVMGDQATLIKKVIPGLGKNVKIQTLKVSDIDIATCEPRDGSIGPIPTLP